MAMGQPTSTLTDTDRYCAYAHQICGCPPPPPACRDGLIVVWSATGDRELAACDCTACLEDGVA